jgi:hypothetical protein
MQEKKTEEIRPIQQMTSENEESREDFISADPHACILICDDDGSEHVREACSSNCLKTISAADVLEEDLKWLWDPYMQGNHITLLRGDGGTGKTFLACAVAATVTQGSMPGEMPGSVEVSGNVMYCSKEDDNPTIRARFKSVGGNLKKLFLLEEGEGISFNCDEDLEKIRGTIRELGIKLIIFDPIQSFLGSKVDMNRANQIRPIMDKLRAIARDEDCAILIIEHLNKALGQKALYRGIGSVDMVAAARSVLMIGYHPAETDTRVCCQIKTNNRRGDAIEFKIDSNGVFTWQGTSTVTLDEMTLAEGLFSDTSQKDPILEGIKALITANPNGWSGTATKLSSEISKLTGVTVMTPQRIGRRMAKIGPALNKEGIFWHRGHENEGSVYVFFKEV